MARYLYDEPSASTELIDDLRALAQPLRHEADLDPLLHAIGNARIVLLGEASHGTSEYYEWRAKLTKRLLLEKGFSFMAVEGDWPDCYAVNRYVKGEAAGGQDAREVLRAFGRWPTWMWANEEIARLAAWLKVHNDKQRPEKKFGFFGLDVYSLWDSLEQIARYVERAYPKAAREAKHAVHCFEPYGEDAILYARATRAAPASCEDEVVGLLHKLREQAAQGKAVASEEHFVAEMNALVVKNAESYYRAMVRGSTDSWNVRDGHMMETLDRLMEHHGPNAKAIIWEHNTHIGDARYTDMAEVGMVNVGQLVRERYGADDCYIVGFTGHHGSVIAGKEWEAPMQRMTVPRARLNSWEDVLHTVSSHDDKLLIFTAEDASEAMLQPRGQRAIGVVYHPEREYLGNYVPTVLPRRYDAVLAFEATEALHPLEVSPRPHDEVPETFPSAM